jgi:hypothetical protein
MSTRDTLSDLDAQILSALQAAGLSDEMIVRGQRVAGYYRQEWVDRGEGEESTAGHLQVFDARAEGLPAIEEGDMVTVVNHGTFRVLRAEPEGSGRVMVLLGSVL